MEYEALSNPTQPPNSDHDQRDSNEYHYYELQDGQKIVGLYGFYDSTKIDEAEVWFLAGLGFIIWSPA